MNNPKVMELQTYLQEYDANSNYRLPQEIVSHLAKRFMISNAIALINRLLPKNK